MLERYEEIIAKKNSVSGTETHFKTKNSINNNIPQIDEYDNCSSLGEYLEKHYSLNPIGNIYRINPCPKCGKETDKDDGGHFTFYPNTDTFSSFTACCKGGGFQQFLEQVEEIKVNIQTKQDFKIHVREEKPSQSVDLTPLVEQFVSYHPYFKKRGISEAIAKKYKLGFLPDGYNTFLHASLNTFQKNIFNEKKKSKYYRPYRFMLPITEVDGTIKYIITRADESFAEEHGIKVSQKTRNLKGFKVQLFNERYLIDESLSKSDIYIVEGIFDALSLEELGQHAIALNSAANINLLFKLIDKHKPSGKKFIFIPDTDNAGMKAKDKFIDYCTKNNLSYEVKYLPKKDTDVNDMLIDDREQLEEIIKEEKEITVSTIIPSNFEVINGRLFRLKQGKENSVQPILACRQVPYITRKFENVEDHTVFYEIEFNDNGKQKKKVVPAAAIVTKKELLKLADIGLGVTDVNYKECIRFFDAFIYSNDIPEYLMVNRLGYIKNGFVHPLLKGDLEIIPQDIGEKQILDAFQESGTVESWKREVLDLIKPYTKALFYVISAFSSVLFSILKIDSVIVDFSGHTSQGKTTLLRIVASIWGTEDFINEWNTTRVAIERKAGFLNSFPLLMDDTKKADPKILQSIIYQYSGGKSKGRGNISGFQQFETWNNVLLSTGESNIIDYTNAAGVAARVISLVDEPFGKPSYDFFSKLYEGIENNYGIVGRTFIEKLLDMESTVHKKRFNKIKSIYIKEAQGNEVLVRLSQYYAAIHYTAELLNELLGLDIDVDPFMELFLNDKANNKALDKPKQQLEEMLTFLDANRHTISYDRTLYTTMYAGYKKGELWVHQEFMKMLFGNESGSIIREMVKRLYIIPQNGKPSKNIRLGMGQAKMMLLNKEVITELGFNFAEQRE